MANLSRTLITAFFLSLVFVPVVQAAQVVEVFIDARDPAFVVVQGIASDASARAKREMRGYAMLDRVSIVTWAVFRKHIKTLLAPYVVKNEYPESRTLLGVVTLVKAHPGRPYAVTWNGGLASTFQDFQYAATTYEAFTTDAESYERSRPRNRADDPLHPDNQLAVLLSP